MYANLINGELQVAPTKMVVGSRILWNAPSEVYAAQGWLPVIFTNAPVAPAGYYYTAGWVEQEGSIVQTWTLVEETDDFETLYNILVGGS